MWYSSLFLKKISFFKLKSRVLDRFNYFWNYLIAYLYKCVFFYFILTIFFSTIFLDIYLFKPKQIIDFSFFVFGIKYLRNVLIKLLNKKIYINKNKFVLI